MKQNKGIIGLGLIVAIVLGIVVVGGGAYLLGTKKNTKVVENPNVTNKLEENNSHEVPTGPYGDETNYVAPNPVVNNPTNPVVSTGCTSSSTPSIKVLSPNGGETYTAGQKITVKWSSCNVSASSYDIIVALHQNGDWQNVVYLSNATINDGNEIFTIPSNITAGSYKIRVGSSVAKIQQDFSDGLFTINSTTHVSNLKTYTNSDYGFSFQYPEGMSVKNDNYPNVNDKDALWLMVSYDNVPLSNDYLRISVTSKLYDGGREACDKGWDNNYFTHTNINNLDFIKGDASSAFSGMNSRKTATGYCYTATNGNQYVLTDIGSPSSIVSDIIKSFKLVK
jgi:hypothetical protein